MNVDALTIAAGGLGAVGLVAGTRFIVSWLRVLLKVAPDRVPWLATGVALFQVCAFGMTQTTWIVGGVDVASGAAWAAVGLYVTCLLGSGAAAVYEMESRVAVKTGEPEPPKTGAQIVAELRDSGFWDDLTEPDAIDPAGRERREEPPPANPTVPYRPEMSGR